MRKGLFATLRTAFISGLLVLAPLAVTVWIIARILDLIGGTFRPILFFYLPESLRDHRFFSFAWNVLATLIVLVAITGLGYLSRYVFGQYFGGLAERFIQNIPGVNTVYHTVKQLVDTFSTQNRNLFSKVVLIEYPRKGVRTIGFLTNQMTGEVKARTGADLWAVFVPTTPNPTSGFLLLLPKEEIIELDMSVGDGMKFVISGGTVLPGSGGSRSPHEMPALKAGPEGG
jgi:uncharacterized membrane protein